MSEKYEQLPLFDTGGDWTPGKPAETNKPTMSDRFTQVINDHLLAIDLIDLTMRVLKSPRPMTKTERAQWDAMCMEIMKRNSPVVIFLVRAIADLLTKIGADRENVMTELRQAAGSRLSVAEEMLKKRGYE